MRGTPRGHPPPVSRFHVGDRHMARSLVLVASLVVFVTATFAEEDARNPKADEDGFISLFNGTDLAGWQGDTKYWSFRDGAITGESTKANPLKHNTFLVWQGGDVRD